MSRSFGVLLGVLSLLASPVARADDRRVVLEYSADPGCPTRAEFVAQVMARTRLAEFVHDPSAEQRFTVSTRSESGRTVGRFAATRGHSTGNPRQVSSDRCQDVIAALALIAALTIDPHADSTQPSAPETPVPADVNAPPTQASSATPRDQLERPASEQRGTERGHPLLAPAPSSGRSAAWLLGAGASGAVWPTVPVVPFGGLVATLEREPLGRSPVLPTLRLSLARSASTSARPSAGGAAHFGVYSVQLDLCPVTLGGRFVALRACFGIEGGLLRATGISEAPIVHSQSQNRAWWAVHETLELLVNWNPSWSSALGVGLAEALARDRFVFDFPATPAAPAHQAEILHVPVWSAVAQLRLARRSW